MPPKIEGDKILFVLDRSVVEQQLGMFEFSSRDLEAGDKQVEVLDFSRGTLDDIAQVPVLGRLRALRGARVREAADQHAEHDELPRARRSERARAIEARRFAVMQKFISDTRAEREHDRPGSYLAGFMFEKSGAAERSAALLRRGAAFAEYRVAAEPVQRLAARRYRSPELTEADRGAAGTAGSRRGLGRSAGHRQLRPGPREDRPSASRSVWR